MPTDRQGRSPLLRWLVPAVTFVAGAVAGTAFTQPAPAPAPAQLSVPTFGASSTPEGAANSAALGELALYRDINDKFVEQLRRYDARLKAIADDAEGDGASRAAADMRDFALETELLIDRYDLILKQN
jgi:hypothetical protein